MQKVTIDVPVERVPEFYQMFGLWLANEGVKGLDLTHFSHDQPVRRTWHESDVRNASIVWAKLSNPAKAIFRRLMSTPGEKVSAFELAELAGLEANRFAVAGALAWPARHCYAEQREFPIRFAETDDTTWYWMFELPAKLFKDADLAEGINRA